MRRTWDKWTDDEDRIILEALGRGLTQGKIAPLLEGRSLSKVQNRIRQLRCRAASVCRYCGASGVVNKEACDACHTAHKENSRKRVGKLKASGMCSLCGVNRADATLTLCHACRKRMSSYRKVNESPTPVVRTGLLRWAGSLGHNIHVKRFPMGVQVVDLFGGSASYSLKALSSGFQVAAYNDIHPGLYALVSCVRDGDGDAVLDACRHLEGYSVEDLMCKYRDLPSLSRVERAAATFMVALSVDGKNMVDMKCQRVARVSDSLRNRFRLASEALPGVEVHNLDYRDAIARFDGPNTLFFCDPPYPETSMYEYNLAERHTELIADLSRIRGKYYLVYGSTRTSASLMRQLPHVYRHLVQVGPMRVREFIATNYPLSDDHAVPMVWSDFGL